MNQFDFIRQKLLNYKNKIMTKFQNNNDFQINNNTLTERRILD